MHISITDAKAQLTALVRRAEAGEEVVLTRHGHPAAHLTASKVKASSAQRRAQRLAAIDRAIAAAKVRGPDGLASAARSADHLYGDDGLPA